MSNSEFLLLKQNIFNYCGELLDKRISEIRENMSEIQLSANTDTKSSMGDKYETSRAMAMLEIENFSKQLERLLLQKKVLDSINPNVQSKIVGLGALIETDSNLLYYMAAGLGKIEVEGHTVFAISPVSPVGKALSTLLPGQIFDLNGKQHRIKRLA